MTIDEIKEELKRMRTQAYLDYSNILNKDVCKGAEYKIEHKTFGTKELENHCMAREKYGKHIAFNEALILMTKLLDK
jgi:hypothetical protein